jgi:hypothetical protein
MVTVVEQKIAFANRLSPFSSSIPSRPLDYGMVPPTFKAGLSTLVNPLWKHPHRHIQRCALLISEEFLNPTKINYHSKDCYAVVFYLKEQ